MATLWGDPTEDSRAWLDAFTANPEEELARLLRGYVSIPRFEQVSTLETARLLFSDLPASAPVRVALDHALSRWLETRRREPLRAEGGALNRWLGELVDALLIVSLLQLPVSAKLLRTKFIAWNAWADRHFFLGRPDPRAAFMDALACTQQLIATSEPGINPFGLEPHWLDLCAEAGGKYPRSYLTTALLGLRFLPARPQVPNERPWITGLAVWALIQQPSTMDFAREWGGLKRIYFDTPHAWEVAVRQTLDRRAFNGLGEDIVAFWNKDVGIGRASPSAKRERSRCEIAVPAFHEVKEFLAVLDEPVKRLETKIRRLVSEREQYAHNTGDSEPLMYATSRIGSTLLKRMPDARERVARGGIAASLATLALRWQPDDSRNWALWRNSLVALGKDAEAELVGWETIRRFPEDARLRSQLAGLLLRSEDGWSAAEALLRETIDRFPDDEYPRNQLGNLLAKMGRAAEAEEILLETHEKLDSITAGNLWAHLVSRRRTGHEKAEALLRSFLARAPRSVSPKIIHTRTILARLIGKDSNRDEETEELLRETDELISDPTARNQLAFIMIRAGRIDEARELLQATLKLRGLGLEHRNKARQYLEAISKGAVPEASEEWEETDAGAVLAATEEPAEDEALPARRKDTTDQARAQAAALDRTTQESNEQPADARGPIPSAQSEPSAPQPAESATPGAPARETFSEVAVPGKSALESNKLVSASLTSLMLRAAGNNGELRRIAAKMRNGDSSRRERVRGEALAAIEARGEPNSTYGDFVLKWVLQAMPDALSSDSFSLGFVEALRARDFDRMEKLNRVHGGLTPLTDVARAALQRDRKAAERIIAWLKDSKTETRASAALRGFMHLRLGGPPSDADALIETIAANDNVILDLEEAVLAEADRLLVA